MLRAVHLCFFFFNDTATTEIYTLSLHDALPISPVVTVVNTITNAGCGKTLTAIRTRKAIDACGRSEEHTSELQSQSNLVCRLLLEKKKTIKSPPLYRPLDLVDRAILQLYYSRSL